MQIISENFNASSTVDLRLEILAEQFRNITATVSGLQAATSHDITSLKSWVKKLLKENKKIDLKMSTLEKVANERGKQAWTEKKQQGEVTSNLNSQVEEQRQQISALTAGKKRLHKAMDRMQEDIKEQHVQIARFQQQMKSALQNDALSVRPTSPDRDPPAAPPVQRAKVLNQSPSGAQRSPTKEGSICNVKSMLHFPNSSTENYATFSKNLSTGLFEMTICSWVSTKSNYLGTILSYATEDNDNKLVLHGRNTSKQSSIHLVIGDPAYRELPVEPLLDGHWHHLCIIWSSFEGKYWYYIDRRLIAAGSKFQKGYEIPAGGILIVGQEQDKMGGEFDHTEAFVGNLAGFTIWNRALSPGEVSGIATGKALPGSRILTFNDISTLNGAIQHVNCTCLDHCY